MPPGTRLPYTLASIASCLAGCASHSVTLPSSYPAALQDEAGTVLISPALIAPWDEISSNLRPAFVLTGDQAASQVLPMRQPGLEDDPWGLES
jgi:hypothetical protein